MCSAWENPTRWTQETMQSWRNMVRTVCELRYAAGDLIGSHAVVLRADTTMAPTPAAEALVGELARQDGVARVQLWTAAAAQTPDTAEMRSRGKQALAAPPAALGVSGPTVIGVYALLCVRTRGDPSI